MSSINNTLRKLLPAIIFTILNYVSQAAAENVTIEKILDLSVFGACNIYLKRFRDNQRTVDLTEKLILVQHQLRKDYALTCIENARYALPSISPTVNLSEGCVLNIIIGILSYDVRRLGQFMVNNNYTYSAKPFSTYIWIPDAFHAKIATPYPHFAVLLLPVRVFYLRVPSLLNDDVNLYTHPCLLVCAHCRQGKKMAVNSNLAYISSFNFSSSWLTNDVQVLYGLMERHDIKGCENAPWRDFSKP
jgi:hypothetical protein